MRVKNPLQESLQFETALERDRQRASVANSVPELRIGTFPTTMPRNIFFRMRAKNPQPGSQYFRTAPEYDQKSASVVNSVPNHRIGAFPSTLPRNISFACARKICTYGADISEST